MLAITSNGTVNPPSPLQKNEVRPFFEDAPTRIRLYGSKTTQKRLCQKIANLLLGKSHYQYPLSQIQVCKTLHLDKKTVRKYTRIAAQYGFLKIDDNGKLQHPEVEQSEFVLFVKNPQDTDSITVRQPTVSTPGRLLPHGGFEIGDRNFLH